MLLLRNHCDNILKKVPSYRLLALDVFRGMTIMAMIMVNNPGSWSHIYAPLRHADWHGWTVTDLIFPFFVFIVGVAISFSIGIQKDQAIPKFKIIQMAAIRSIKLILLGWFLAIFYYKFGDMNFNWFEDKLLGIRFMGVLQRIGLVYFCCVALFLFIRPKALILWVLSILTIYGLMMLYLPYSDDTGQIYQGLLIKGNNLSAWFDQLVLGSDNVFAKTLPFSFDPEGLLSTLPAVATCLTGVLLGSYLQWAKSINIPLVKQVGLLSLIGIVTYISGELLQFVIPINKTLWTPSYVLMSSGLATLTLALFIYVIDIKKNRRWGAPFIVFGANAIAFFMFAGITGRLLVMIPVADTQLKNWLYQTIFAPSFGMLNGSLMFAISFLILSYILMHWMYRNNIFWKA
ncbi:MAG: DUF5009 domain-containing protein [Gammaproteobacteria bacterium]|nr:MAG: DUF5009 domain-containing protein [Gammaproteobacteria bacterium]